MSGGPSVRAWLDLGTLRVAGPDARSWLNGLVTCDVQALTTAQARWGLVLSRTGKIQSEIWIVQAGEELLFSVSPGLAEQVVTELDRMLIMEDAELTNDSEMYRWFSLHGTAAVDVAARAATQFSGWSSAITFSAVESAVLCVPASQSAAIAELFELVADADWESLRLRLNLPMFGVDYTSNDRPHEVGLERRTISWTKGCYLGQEVVCMQDMRGKVKRSVRRLAIKGIGKPESLVGKAVRSADREIGTVSSAGVAPEGDGCWCFASVLLAQLDGPLSIPDVSGQVTLVDQ